ncbi:MAG: hypothetical protein AAF723_01945 [Pseudomonadota bacterium]
MKFVLIFLTSLLVTAVAGRFQAEAEVRQSQIELSSLEEEVSNTASQIERVRLDVEVLESARRLNDLNETHLSLKTVKASQLADDRDFAETIGVTTADQGPVLPENADVIGNAIGMIDPAIAEKAVGE